MKNWILAFIDVVILDHPGKVTAILITIWTVLLLILVIKECMQ